MAGAAPSAGREAEVIRRAEREHNENIVLKTLIRANGPLTRDELKLEAVKLSSGQIRRALKRLVEEDVVERCDDPQDRRRTLYRLPSSAVRGDRDV